jgi:hypothetical protein
MAMPNHLVFIRHGQSEANVVQRADKDGHIHEMADSINDRPDWEQRSSDRGIQQTLQAKESVDAHLGMAKSFGLHYFSPFLCTRETAAYPGGPQRGEWIRRPGRGTQLGYLRCARSLATVAKSSATLRMRSRRVLGVPGRRVLPAPAGDRSYVGAATG